MPAFVDSTPMSDRFEVICKRAKSRSIRSEIPERFMNEFFDELSAVRREGMDGVVERAPDWNDPIHLAAEVEALAGMRAMRNWGTTEGLCLTRRKRGVELTA